jgi:hypothetical protein
VRHIPAHTQPSHSSLVLMPPKRRFDVEFLSASAGRLPRLDRVPFDDTQPIRVLRDELVARSGWRSEEFDICVRRGYDGPRFHLDDKDVAGEAVGDDESESACVGTSH